MGSFLKIKENVLKGFVLVILASFSLIGELKAQDLPRWSDTKKVFDAVYNIQDGTIDISVWAFQYVDNVHNQVIKSGTLSYYVTGSNGIVTQYTIGTFAGKLQSGYGYIDLSYTNIDPNTYALNGPYDQPFQLKLQLSNQNITKIVLSETAIDHYSSGNYDTYSFAMERNISLIQPSPININNPVYSFLPDGSIRIPYSKAGLNDVDNLSVVRLYNGGNQIAANLPISTSGQYDVPLDISTSQNEKTFYYNQYAYSGRVFVNSSTVKIPAFALPTSATATYSPNNQQVSLTWNINPVGYGASVIMDNFKIQYADNSDFAGATDLTASYNQWDQSYFISINKNLAPHLFFRVARDHPGFDWTLAQTCDVTIPLDPIQIYSLALQNDNSAYLTWNPSLGSFTPKSTFVITRINNTTQTQTAITLSQADYVKGNYTDKQILLCNQYTYALQVIPPVNSSFTAQAAVQYSNNILPTKIGTIVNLAATKGYFPDRTELSWTSVGVFDNFIIKRAVYGTTNYVQLPSVTGSATGDFQTDDTKGTPGTYYTYMVVGSVNCNNIPVYSKDTLYTIGFRSPTGNIYGRVTYANGQGVANAAVRLQSNDAGPTGKSIYLDGSTNNYLKINSLLTPFSDTAFTVETWIKPDIAGLSNKQVIFSRANQYELGLNNGQIYFKNSNNIVSAAYQNPNNSFIHVAGIRTMDSLIIMVNNTVLNKVPAPFSTVLNAGNGVYIGCDTLINNQFQGFIDEMRVWNIGVDTANIARDYTRLLTGGENGLVAYWRFDENIKGQFFDLSHQGDNYNQNDGNMADIVVRSSTIPSIDQLSLNGLTDSIGNYMVSGIPYTNNGITYTIAPLLGTHKFIPLYVNRLLSASSNQFTVDFVDNSSFPVLGKVVYNNGTFPVAGVQFKIDGQYAQKSDGSLILSKSDGTFQISVPVGYHTVQAVMNNHVFADSGKIIDLQGNLNYQAQVNDIILRDNSTVRLIGRVAGGSIQDGLPLGHSLSKNNLGKIVSVVLNVPYTSFDFFSSTIPQTITVNHFLPSNQPDTNQVHKSKVVYEKKRIVIYPDSATGEFAADLIPISYVVQSVNVTGYDNLISIAETLDLTNKFFVNNSINNYIDSTRKPNSSSYTYKSYIDTVKYNAAYKKIKRVDPLMSIKQIDASGVLLNYFGDSSYLSSSLTGITTLVKLTNSNVDGIGKYAFGNPVFNQGNAYNFMVNAYEAYPYYDTVINNIKHILQFQGNDVVSNVPTQNGLVSILNNIRNGAIVADTFRLDNSGKGYYSFSAGDPNLASLGIKDFSASLQVGSASTTNWDWLGFPKMQALVLGGLTTGKTFVTAGPDKVLMVLRDPPGATSFSSLQKGSVLTSNSTYTTSVDTVGDHSVALTLGGAVTTFAGIGAGIIIETANLITGTGSLHHEGHQVNSNTYTTSNTITTNFQTSSDPNFVGAPADVFVGNSTNITYGVSNNITIVKKGEENLDPILVDPGNGYVIIQRGGIMLGEIFGTLFAYPQAHIQNVLIPNLITIRNTLLLPPNTVGAQEMANRTKQQVYVSYLLPTNPLFGKTNNDKIFTAPNVRYDSGASYKIYFPVGMTAAPTDSISTLNQYVAKWERELAKNERDKLQSKLKQNYSFHAGSPITYSEETSVNHTNTESFSFIISGGLTLSTNFSVSKLGVAISLNENIGRSRQSDVLNETDSTTNIGFTLSSSRSDDYFSVDVNKDSSNNFVFRTKGGVSGCPYEGANLTKYYQPGTTLDEPTQRIEVPKLSVDVPIVNNIPTSRSASYTLSLANQSEAKLSNTYVVSYADNDSIKGATIAIDGTPIGGGGRVVVVPFGSVIQKVLTITKGPVAMDYNNIMVILKSACEDGIADTVLLSAHFIPSCSDIHIKEPVDKWVLNTLSDTINKIRFLPVTIDQFDVNNILFDHIELQYKPAAASVWVSTMNFYADTAKMRLSNKSDTLKIVNAQAINYNMFMDDVSFSDQNYNIRAVSYCKLSASKVVTTESNIVSGIKDTYNPRLFGSAQPANGILGISDNIRLNFNEPIASGLLSTNDFKVTGIRNGVQGDHSVSVNLDGVSNYIQTEFAKNLTGKSTTTEMWILPNSNINETLFSQGNANESMEVALTADKRMQLIVGKKVLTSDPLTFKLGEWAHVALVYNAKDTTVSSYFNFVPVFKQPQHVAYYNGIGTYQFGRSVSKSGNFFSGKIHRAVVWSDTLSAISIQLNSLLQLSGAENNLIALYPMDEGKGTVCFDKAHGSNATLNGNWTTPAGKAFKFGGNGYLNLNTSFAPVSSKMDYTMELWFKGDPNQTAAALASNGKGDTTDIGGSLNNFFLGFENKLLTFTNNGFKIQADGNYLDNKWHHVAIAVSRTASIAQLYVDGTLKNYFDAKNIGGIAAANTYLGARGWSVNNPVTGTTDKLFDRYFNGNIDEFRIWNTYLNQTIINKNNNVRLQGDELGLMAYYPFEKNKLTPSNQQQMDSTLMDLKIQIDPNVIVPYGMAVNAVISDLMAPVKDRGPVVNLLFDYVINNDALIINLNEPKQSVNKTIITLQVSNVKDLNGNQIFSPITWSAYIDQNQLKWSDVSLNLSKGINAPMQFESYIVNSGGNIQNFSLSNLPRWLIADVSSGTVPPLGKQKIIFTVNEALNVGTYDEVLFMRNDDNEAEALSLNMVVKGKKPDWSVNPAAFKYNMNVYGKLRINNLYSIDKDDLLAAFINGKCVGVAKNVYNAQSDLWFAFLTVYNDSIQNSNLKFRIWQANTGKVYQAIPSANVSFVSNDIVGSIRNPIIFDGNENIFQDITLNKGWNWISFNVLDKSTASNINETLSNGNWSAGDVIKNELTGFSQYGNQTGWLGYLAGVNNTSLFTLKTNNAQSLSVSGVAVDVRVTPIPVSGNRWSYISYLPQVNLTLKDALADYDAKNEDVIKSQSGFAMYDDVVGWVGNLTFMEPGKGYMLYRKSINDISFYYPMIKSLFRVAPVKNYISGLGINSAQMPVAANTGFSQNMTVTAKEGTGFVLQPNDLVMAYSAGEIRAKSRLIENAVLKIPTLFFNISGEQDEAIYFQVERNGIVVAQSETVLTYGANTQVGTLSKPLLLNFTEASNAILVYPNPFVQKVMINVKVAGIINELHGVQLSIYDALGQPISTLPEKQARSGIFQTYWNGKTANGVNCMPGIYFIHITIDGVTQVQKVIKI